MLYATLRSNDKSSGMSPKGRYVIVSIIYLEQIRKIRLCGTEIVMRNAKYTNKEKIQGLGKKHAASGSEAPRNKTVTSTSPCKTRSHVKKVNWEQCIFCQNEHSKERLSSVMTFNMSDNIMQNAQFNSKV